MVTRADDSPCILALSCAGRGRMPEGASLRQRGGATVRSRPSQRLLLEKPRDSSGSSAVSVSVFDGFRFLSADPSGRERTRANSGGSACCCYPLRSRPEIVLSRYLVGGNLGGNGSP